MCTVRVPIEKHYGIGCLLVPITFPWTCSSLSVDNDDDLYADPSP